MCGFDLKSSDFGSFFCRVSRFLVVFLVVMSVISALDTTKIFGIVYLLTYKVVYGQALILVVLYIPTNTCVGLSASSRLDLAAFFSFSLSNANTLKPLPLCAPQPLPTPRTAGFRGFGHGVEVPLGPRTGGWRCRSGRRPGTRKDLCGQDHRPSAVQAQREVQHAEVRQACNDGPTTAVLSRQHRC